MVAGSISTSVKQNFPERYQHKYSPEYIKSHYFKDDEKSVRRIGSARIEEGIADINIAQISHLSNFSDLKLQFIFIYDHNKPEQIDIQL